MPKIKPLMMVRIEPDNERQVRTQRKIHGRSVQGEVNHILRGAYQPKYKSKSDLRLKQP